MSLDFYYQDPDASIIYNLNFGINNRWLFYMGQLLNGVQFVRNYDLQLKERVDTNSDLIISKYYAQFQIKQNVIISVSSYIFIFRQYEQTQYLVCSYNCSTQQCPDTWNVCSQCSNPLRQNIIIQEVNQSCGCKEGYYQQNYNEGYCYQCSIICKECYFKQDQCYSCVNSRYYDSNNYNCICKDGKVKNSIEKECPNCQIQCQLCENFDNNCTQCSDINRDINTNPKCQCIPGYFHIINQKLCGECLYNCKQCITQNNNCTLCHDTQNRILNGPNKQCECKLGFYELTPINAYCGQCDYKCQQCETTNIFCILCSDTNRVLVGNNFRCECNEGYFEQPIQNKICGQCNYKCKSCQVDAQNCLSCTDTNRNLIGINYKCECKDGYFEINNQIQCGQCKIQCKKCENTANNCTECQGLYKLSPPNCDCIHGYYNDGYNIDCLQCEPQCDGCKDFSWNCIQCTEPINYSVQTFCKICDQVQFRNINNCECEQGYYEIYPQLICLQCNTQCMKCKQAPNFCTQCQLHKGRNNDPPFCTCKKGYYQNQENNQCEICLDSCRQCVNNFECTECIQENEKLPLCQKQVNYNNSQNQISENNQNNNNYQNENEIINNDNINYDITCKYQCISCVKTSKNCTICRKGMNRSMVLPECQCKQGYYSPSFLKIDCLKCNDLCDSCSKNQIQCDACKEGLNRQLNSISQQCECIEGFIQSDDINNKKCQQCYFYQNICYIKCPYNTQIVEKSNVCQDKTIEIQQQSILDTIYITLFIILIFLGIGYYVIVMIFKKQIKQKSVLNLNMINQIFEQKKQNNIQVNDIDLNQVKNQESNIIPNRQKGKLIKQNIQLQIIQEADENIEDNTQFLKQQK